MLLCVLPSPILTLSRDVRLWHKCEVRDVRYLVAISGKADVADIAFL